MHYETNEQQLSAIREAENNVKTNDTPSKKRVGTIDHSNEEGENHQPWYCGDKFKYPLSKSKDNVENEDPWKECHETATEFDADMVQRQRSEVDNLLIFAGLFSAVVTAFTIESYKWPQGNLGNGFTSSVPQPYVGPAWAIQVNALWFISLTLSVSVSLLSILCMQWLREYQAYPSLSHKRAFELRQLRFEGLEGWYVLTVLRILPFLLQLALVFFFAGLLMLLGQLHANVAIGVAIIVGITLTFLVITSLMPTVQFLKNRGGNLRVKQCPYKSFQSWMILWIVTDFQRFLFNPGMFLHIIGSWCLGLSVLKEEDKTSSSQNDPRSRRNCDAEQGRSDKSPRCRSFVPKFVVTFGKWATTRFTRDEEDEDILNISESWDWIQYDMYWRKQRNPIRQNSRDSISLTLSSRNSSSITEIDLHHDVINGLQWMHHCRAFGSAGTLLVHPCVRNLELEVAARVLRGISGTKEGDNDCLSWVLQRYSKEISMELLPCGFWKPSKKFNKDIIDLEKQLKTSAVYQEMVSLLALRLLSREPIFKGAILEHYLELYTRLKNTLGDNTKSFFTKPLRVLPNADPENLPFDAMSHDDFVTEIFLSNPYLPADSFIQLLVYWTNYAKLARKNVSPTIEDSEIILEDSPSNSDSSGSSFELAELQLAWKQMQPAWNIFSQWLKRSMSKDLLDDQRLLRAVRDLILEIQAYTRIFCRRKRYRPLQDCAHGIRLVVGTMEDKNRQTALFKVAKDEVSMIKQLAHTVRECMQQLNASGGDPDWPNEDVHGFIQFLDYFVLDKLKP